MRVFYLSGARSKERRMLEYSTNIEYREVSIHLRRDIGFLLLKKLYKCLAIMRRFSPELILIESPGACAIAAVLLKRMYKVKLVTRIKGVSWKEYEEINCKIPLKEKIAKFLNFRSSLWILKNSDEILPISKSVRDYIKYRVSGNHSLRIVHIPYNERGDDATSVTYHGKRYILTVTNFNFWGKVKPLMETIPIVFPLINRMDLEWLILGDGFFLDKCKDLSRRYQDHVKFLGRRNAYIYYKGPVIYMLYISGMDGLPNVLLEASINKLPIIVDRESPAAEFIKDGYNGIVADLNDEGCLLNTMERLVKDEAYRRKLGENANAYVHKNFSLERVSIELEEALRRCLNDVQKSI